jgi:hypothetical protein
MIPIDFGGSPFLGAGVDATSSGSRSDFFVTLTFPSLCTTFQQGTGLSAGAWSASPVRRLKQA